MHSGKLNGVKTALNGPEMFLNEVAKTLNGCATILNGREIFLNARATSLNGRETVLNACATILNGREMLLNALSTALSEGVRARDAIIGAVYRSLVQHHLSGSIRAKVLALEWNGEEVELAVKWCFGNPPASLSRSRFHRLGCRGGLRLHLAQFFRREISIHAAGRSAASNGGSKRFFNFFKKLSQVTFLTNR